MIRPEANEVNVHWRNRNDEIPQRLEAAMEIKTARRYMTDLNSATHADADPLYVPKDIKSKRFRRTKAAVASVRGIIKDILEKDNPQTVRQVFYALTVRGVIAKDEIEYKRTVVRLLGEMRETGQIPFEWIADNTRLMRKPSTFSGIEACLTATSNFYRRDLWAAMPVYVEVWVEKDALSGVLFEETNVYDVPLMPARGYSSLTFLHSAAMAIKARGKPAFIYHFGDLDPSGVDAGEKIAETLRELAPDADIIFERLAVTPEQITAWALPTRPTKPSDTRSKGFCGRRSARRPRSPTSCRWAR